MKNGKALIIDFDPEALKQLTEFIQGEGYKAVAARDGLAGWDQYKSQQPELVIMEAMLPKLNGFELCKKIVTDSRGSVPVIMITGVYRENSYKVEALQIFGASAYYAKPWDRQELKAKIRQLMEGKNGKTDEREKESAAARSKRAPEQPAASSGLRTPEPIPNMENAMPYQSQENLQNGKVDPKTPAKEKKSGLSGDIEGMLKDTLADLGFDTKKPAKPEIKPEPKPAPKVEPKPTPKFEPRPEPKVEFKAPFKFEPKPEPKKEFKIEPPAKPKFEFKPEPRVEKPIDFKVPESKDFELRKEDFRKAEAIREEPRPAPAVEKKPFSEKIHVEKKPEAAAQPTAAAATFASTGPLGEYEEPKKKSSAVLIGGIAAGVVVIAVGAWVVMKPKKAPVVPQRQTISQQAPLQTTDTAFVPTQVGTDTQPNPQAAEAKPAPAKANEPAKKAPEKAPAQVQADAEPAPILPTTQSLGEPKIQANLPAPEAAKTEAAPATQPAAQPQPQDTKAAEPTVKAGDLVNINEVDVQPQITYKALPQYPKRAFDLGIEGSITVNVLVSETGAVIKTEIFKGMKNSAGLEKAAEDAAKLCKFRSAMKSGVPVKTWVPIAFLFTKKK